jgi:hypothetical protein
MFNTSAFKALGPDGLHGIFNQSQWHTIYDLVKGIFSGEISIADVTETLFRLIPKI